jgi:hypothetical protein
MVAGGVLVITYLQMALEAVVLVAVVLGVITRQQVQVTPHLQHHHKAIMVGLVEHLMLVILVQAGAVVLEVRGLRGFKFLVVQLLVVTEVAQQLARFLVRLFIMPVVAEVAYKVARMLVLEVGHQRPHKRAALQMEQTPIQQLLLHPPIQVAAVAAVGLPVTLVAQAEQAAPVSSS